MKIKRALTLKQKAHNEKVIKEGSENNDIGFKSDKPVAGTFNKR
jgi:hypothetical protein